MKNIILLSILVLFSISCVTTKKYASIVDPKTKDVRAESNLNDWLLVHTEQAEPQQTKYNQKKNSFVPAIFYWGWNSTIECELDFNTRLEYVRNGIYRAADSLDLKQYAGDKKIEIKLKDIPGKFLYENKGNTIIVVVAYAVSVFEAISPYPINLTYDYTITNNGESNAQGEGSIQNKEQPLGNRKHSTKKFTWMYLDEYKKETDRMGVELVKDLINELKS
ncbi:hypothetical protein SAMN06265379_106151 [Saccharicrinis carchari]|uniref:Lipoprotein n=1 Tax=Saccharicrinis carchari TaxID=1168039 RepID=A0A521DTM3_SACCC|nr:hypothetical protein [Saccharicrinis carchari]SMO74975.1 hypothetical protein SAMN06265379_106151 [Saccharicrinis carchari]